MKKIASFTIDHEKLMPGVYVSRRDTDKDTGCVVTTFDLRVIAPNREPAMDIRAAHTVEHLGATFLRNSELKDKIVYFGPMGCLTGFYLVVFGNWEAEEVFPYIQKMCDFVIDYDGEIPGAKPKECGNYSLHDLDLAKETARKYSKDLKNKNMIYPE